MTSTTVRNPATHQVIDTPQDTSESEVHAVVEDVARFQRGGWATSAKHRAETLAAWAAAIGEHRSALVADLVAQTGKPMHEAEIEVSASVDALLYNAGLCRLVGGAAGTLSDGSVLHTVREPLGVAAFIVPWNWPMLLLFRDLAPGLAAGVGAVVKPSPQAAAVTHTLIEIGRRSGLPRDAVRLVTGDARVGSALIREPSVRGVAFTGSTDTGVAIMQAAAESMTRPLLELGGKGVALIMPDADIDSALATLVPATYITSGQMCMACTRVLAHRDILDEIVAGFVARAKALPVGDPTNPDTRMGPLISHEHGARVTDHLTDLPPYAEVVLGGGRVSPAGLPGFFMEPTVIAGLRPTDTAIQTEIFGPVVSIEGFTTEAEAVDLANSTPFGLASSVWTADVDRAWRLGSGMAAGTVWVNDHNRSYPEMPSGGFHMSGLGRTRGLEGLHHFTEVKNLHFTPPRGLTG